MKTLVINLYDEYEPTAALISEDGVVETVELADKFYNVVTDRVWLKYNKDIDDEEVVSRLVTFNNFVAEYASIVVCQNGHIEKIK